MTEKQTLLIGEWEFINAEQRHGDEWTAAPYTKDLVWRFHPDYISESKTIGVIVECSPQVSPHALNYLYREADKCLRIEVYSDPVTRIKDETDIYELSQVVQTHAHTTITLSLMNPVGCPTPTFRYTLRHYKREK